MGREDAYLKRTSPRFPIVIRGQELNRLRRTECLRGVQEVWKLFGNGSVGSQALTGIPRVAELRDSPELTEHALVWPFETGFTPDPTKARDSIVIVAEIWPGIVPIPTGRVRDEKQVKAMVGYVADLDQRGSLGALFDRPPGLDEEGLGQCVEEEGWILGVRCQDPKPRLF